MWGCRCMPVHLPKGLPEWGRIALWQLWHHRISTGHARAYARLPGSYDCSLRMLPKCKIRPDLMLCAFASCHVLQCWHCFSLFPPSLLFSYEALLNYTLSHWSLTISFQYWSPTGKQWTVWRRGEGGSSRGACLFFWLQLWRRGNWYLNIMFWDLLTSCEEKDTTL